MKKTILSSCRIGLLLMPIIPGLMASSILPPPNYLGFGQVSGILDAGSPAFYTNGGIGFGNKSGEITFYRSDATDRPNNLRFDPVPFSGVNYGDEFLLGYLTFTNGLWRLNTETILLNIQTLDSANPRPPVAGGPATSSFTQSGQYLLSLLTTDNIGDDAQNADILFISPVTGGGGVSGTLGSLRVFERRSATVELYARFGSLNLSRFGAVTSPTGSGFVYNGCTDCLIQPGFNPNATGNGTFFPAAPTVGSEVPEPSSVVFVGLGILGMVGVRRRLASQKRVGQ